jgi:hypothetical protein
MFKTYARPVGYVALLGTIVPPVLFMFGAIAIEPVKAIMLVACVAWFVAAPFWMKTE